MKKIEDCKAYYQDVFMTQLTYKTDETLYRFIALQEALEFIYGGQSYCAMSKWRQETLNEFYS